MKFLEFTWLLQCVELSLSVIYITNSSCITPYYLKIPWKRGHCVNTLLMLVPAAAQQTFRTKDHHEQEPCSGIFHVAIVAAKF